MHTTLPNSLVPTPDPIIEELHAVRAMLLAEHQGDLHAYAEAAKARTIALGFQMTIPDARGSSGIDRPSARPVA